MYTRKFLFAILIGLFCQFNLYAQKMNNYVANWKKVSAFEEKGLTASAWKEVKAIMKMATTAGNEPQLIKAAMHEMKYRNMTEENSTEKNIAYLDSLATKSSSPAKNILQSMQADLMLDYLNQNRYDLYDRTKLAVENDKDISTWSMDKFVAEISSLYNASLSNEAVLKKTYTAAFEAILTKGKNTKDLRPTIFDLLAHRALDYFLNDENYITKPTYQFRISDENYFAPVNRFTATNFSTPDSSSLHFQGLLLLQKLLKFHALGNNPKALIDADLKRLQFVYENSTLINKASLYEKSLRQLIKDYPAEPLSADAIFQLASIYYGNAGKYKPFTNTQYQFEYNKAKELCEEAINKFPKSDGAVKAQNMLNQILEPGLSLQTEEVNIPGQPFRSLVKYKNTPAIYLRIIKTTKEESQKLSHSDGNYWSKLITLKADKSWKVDLPDLKDHQEHSTEIKTDGLASGIYFLVASRDPQFSLKKNIIAAQVIHISHISYLISNNNDLFVLDRETGKPLKGATVQFWQQNYNYNTRSYDAIRKASYSSNADGYVKIKKETEYYNYSVQVKYQQDELFTDDTYYNYNYNSYTQASQKRTFLFTDRSIYRPGQTVYFKGIVVSTDSSTRYSNVIAGHKTDVLLIDANGTEVGKLTLTSNQYGSYKGSFKIPEGMLNGEFYLKDVVNESTQQISVEEYKRPKFFTEIKKPESTYRLNDSIKVTGSAKAYAGNNIDGAAVTYRVVRKVRYPIWWGWGKMIYPSSNEEMEIAQGETRTDADGQFQISFKAIPDESVDKSSQPVFYYEISADVTDINGETRSGTTTVAVSYQALQLNIIAAKKMPADSLKNIKIKSTNLNDVFEKTAVKLRISKLQEPGKIFRNRYWEMPDQFVMSKETYQQLFPHDVYADEDQADKWPIVSQLVESTDSTSADGTFNLSGIKATAGWYKIEVSCTDKFGEATKAISYIQLTDKNNTNPSDPLQFERAGKIVVPGDKVSYSFSSAFDNIWLIQSLSRMQGNTETSPVAITNGKAYSNDLQTTESDRGGINISYVFVKNNRVYKGVESIEIPWSNKELSISFETFRDKILPGSEEKWKINIRGANADKIAAEALISMYDASLDQFKPHNWQSLQSLWPTMNEMVSWSHTTFDDINSVENNVSTNDALPELEKLYEELNENGWRNNDRITYFFNTKGGFKSNGNVDGFINKSEGTITAPEINQVKFSEPKFVSDKEAMLTDTIKIPKKDNKNEGGSIQIRKNFNETAFFFPDLTTDSEGNISFSFTIPEALTQWKLMSLAHTPELASAYAEKTVITQKPLMVQPNAPRFLREGDKIELSAKLVNMSEKELTGTLQLELFDATTNNPIDGWFKNIFPVQYFTVAAGQSSAYTFPVEIPFTFNSVLGYRFRAVTNTKDFSDGEEAALPVLSSRILVTETLPLNMRNTNSKSFLFEKLLNNKSETLTHQSITVEYSSNPAWYAVQSLPYLMEYPYECAEQTFNRYYANVLAAHITDKMPAIKSVFNKWKTKDTAALLSNLEKNQELKAALLQETPWVLEAKDESTRKKNIALLFDMSKLATEKTGTLKKFSEMQTSNGGFSWFKNGPDDRYITQYILTGIGHLKKLGALNKDDLQGLDPLIKKALEYLDARNKEEYDQLKKIKANLKNNNLSASAIQYLYMRSFFTEIPVPAKFNKAYTHFRDQSVKYWLKNSRYMQGMTALALHRTGDKKTALSILQSLKENAISNEEMGMYWKEFNNGGYWWYQAPVESQALLIEAFSEIGKDVSLVNDLKTWLLKQKQTTNWKSTKATAEACYALLMNGSDWLAENKLVTITLGNTIIQPSPDDAEAGTGYIKSVIPGAKVQTDMGRIKIDVQDKNNKQTGSTSWGAVYWQYFEDMDKVTGAATPLKLTKKLFIEKQTARGPVLQPVNENSSLKVGDKIKVRIVLKADRDMEYLHMKDLRAACMEPVNVLSEYKWQGGLGYYETTKDASVNFFFNWLPKGSYVFEYSLFVTHAGEFNNGVTSIQSMYAPEFSSHSEGIKVKVEEK